MKQLTRLLLSSLVMLYPLTAQADDVRGNAVQKLIEEQSFDELLVTDTKLTSEELGSAAQTLWDKYQQIVKADASRIEEQDLKEIKHGDKTMKFSLSKKGEMPKEGYPLYIALHGGGTAPPIVNDYQWQDMQTYYETSVENGIYVATRGISDTWNLHFVDESYSFYDHLIENLIAFENVDPNRVFILGFSAGGDGVYQITPRMADRWAAANMSAGHHNWLTFDNLYNTPFLIQMGQNDTSYKRNRVAVENDLELDRLQAERGGYVHELFLHHRGSHNSWRDNDPLRGEQSIVSNPEGWLKGEAVTLASKNTNAIDWLNQHQRDPLPSKIIWDPEISAPRTSSVAVKYLTAPPLQAQLTPPKNLMYWLDLETETIEESMGTIEANLDRPLNRIVLKLPDQLSVMRVLIHQDMLDLNQPVDVEINGSSLAPVQLTPELQVMARTLLERGDRSYMFHSEIRLQKDAAGAWQIMN